MITKLLAGSVLSLGALFATFGQGNTEEQAQDCCAANLECCVSELACCVTESKADCCEDSAACCEEARTCCDSEGQGALKLETPTSQKATCCQAAG